MNSSVFGVYGLIMRMQVNSPSDSPNMMQVLLAGSGSGVATSCVYLLILVLLYAHLSI